MTTRDSWGGAALMQRSARHHVNSSFDLEEQLARFRFLYDFAPVGLLVTDAMGGIKEANVASGRLLGRRRDLLIGKPLAVFIAIEERFSFRAALRRVSAAPGTYDMPIRLTIPDGVAADVQATVTTEAPGARQHGMLYWALSPDHRSGDAELF
jgi:PAS domain S-box-containing protein